MASPVSWLSHGTIAMLGWMLIHFLWQGGAIAALAALLMRFCGGASRRYAVGLGALVLMLAAPAATLAMLAGRAQLSLPARFSIFAPSISPSVLPWLVESWLAGVALLALRFAGGFLLLEKRRRGQSRSASGPMLALCLEVQQRLGLARAIRYLECAWLSVPAVVGFIRPAVLLPVAALTGLDEAQLRAVVAHELAHVRRWDFLVNLVQILAETLLFYHPAIWWLNGRIRADREICCDEIAVAQFGNRIGYADALVRYARALAWMEERKSAPGPALAANHGILSERIFHILGLPARRPCIAGLAASLFLLTASLAAASILVLPAVPHAVAHENLRSVAAAFPAHPVREAQTLPAPPPAPAAKQARADAYVLPRRKWSAQIKILRRPKFASLSLPEPPVIADVSAPAGDQPIAPAPAVIAPPRSVAAQKLAALDLTADEYPAATVSLRAQYGWGEWDLGQATSYCKDFALQTVTQGAQRPMLVDDGLKQRLSFFYAQCMFRNIQMVRAYGDGGPAMPAYVALGRASADHPIAVSGSWTLAIHWDPGIAAMLAEHGEARSCSFTQTGNSLSGSCTGAEGSSALSGVIDRRQVRWAWKLPPGNSGRQGELDFIGMVGEDGAINGQSVMVSDSYPTQLQTFTAIPAVGQVALRQ